MKKRPILFSSPMILALLNGTKTQTRRVVKPPAPFTSEDEGIDILWATNQLKCPYGEAGDRLWVQENYSLKPYWENKTSPLYHCFYADGTSQVVSLHDSEHKKLLARKTPIDKKQPGRFMYRSCSRFLLGVTDIRVERLQDISEEDAIAEGIESAEFDDGVFYRNYSSIEVWQKDPIFSYRTLWESIHGAGSWNLTWVWVVEFENKGK